ncbi:hypothetical protein J6590_062654 [Homalodisca vitripennis]|nr:hypothetical protein J6590_062654 [Homalodisca vitripennis]
MLSFGHFERRQGSSFRLWTLLQLDFGVWVKIHPSTSDSSVFLPRTTKRKHQLDIPCSPLKDSRTPTVSCDSLSMLHPIMLSYETPKFFLETVVLSSSRTPGHQQSPAIHFRCCTQSCYLMKHPSFSWKLLCFPAPGLQDTNSLLRFTFDAAPNHLQDSRTPTVSCDSLSMLHPIMLSYETPKFFLETIVLSSSKIPGHQVSCDSLSLLHPIMLSYQTPKFFLETVLLSSSKIPGHQVSCDSLSMLHPSYKFYLETVVLSSSRTPGHQQILNRTSSNNASETSVTLCSLDGKLWSRPRTSDFQRQRNRSDTLPERDICVTVPITATQQQLVSALSVRDNTVFPAAPVTSRPTRQLQLCIDCHSRPFTPVTVKTLATSFVTNHFTTSGSSPHAPLHFTQPSISKE